MSDTQTYQDLVQHVEKFVTITDGVANVDGKQVQDVCFAELGTTTKEVKKAYNDVALVSSAVASVFSEKAQDFLAANKEVDSISTKTKIGEETLNLTTRREMETRNPLTGATSNHKGALTVRRSINTRASEITDIKTLAKERGIKTL